MQVVDTYFTYRDVARIFGLKESRLRYWAQTGFINPSAKQNGRRVYAFSDLIEVKAAKELLDHGIPLQRVRRNLRALRDALPGAANLLGRLRVRSDGETLLVVDGPTALDPISGQMFLDFEIRDLGQEIAEVLALSPRADDGVSPGGRPVFVEAPAANETATAGAAPVDPRGAETASDRSAYGWFLRGLAADSEGADDERALQAYQRAVELDPGLAAAHTNMGNIYHRRADRSAALRCYETACALDPDQPEARYNLANIYEEEGDLDMAIAEYRRALKLAPEFADAHFNLALTLEQVGGRQQAVQHWRRYLEVVGSEVATAEAREVAEEHLRQLEHSGA